MEPQHARLTFAAFLVLSGFIVFNALFMQKDARFLLHAGAERTVPAIKTRDTMPQNSGIRSVKGGTLHAAIRRELSRLHYFPGSNSSRLDGRLDAMTMGAIMAYQYDRGLLVTGRASNALLKSFLFGVELAPQQRKNLPQMSADTRQLVAEIQGILSAKGHYGGKVDGIFKDQTRNAVKRFERLAGLPVSGRISGLLVQELSRSTGVAFTASQK